MGNTEPASAGHAADTAPGRLAGARRGGKYGAEWASRVGDAAAGTLVRRRRSLVAAMASVASMIVVPMAIMLTDKHVYLSFPAAFRYSLAAVGVLAVLNGGIQRFRLPKLTKTAAEAAFGHLRRTGYPQLARLPYSALRSLRAFDSYIATAAMSGARTT